MFIIKSSFDIQKFLFFTKMENVLYSLCGTLLFCCLYKIEKNI
jgi:hypothetical protein